jgi:hypothetical protein
MTDSTNNQPAKSKSDLLLEERLKLESRRDVRLPDSLHDKIMQRVAASPKAQQMTDGEATNEKPSATIQPAPVAWNNTRWWGMAAACVLGLAVVWWNLADQFSHPDKHPVIVAEELLNDNEQTEAVMDSAPEKSAEAFDLAELNFPSVSIGKVLPAPRAKLQRARQELRQTAMNMKQSMESSFLSPLNINVSASPLFSWNNLPNVTDL